MSSEGSPASRPRGATEAAGLRIAIIAARFNAQVTDRLVDGALKALTSHGAHEADIETWRVPGAWELPQAAARAVRAGRYNAIVTLGCVIRGETPHFDYVCQEASLGLGAVARSATIPLAFGVLTTDDLAQALARAGDGPDNKGYEAAMAVLEMVSVFRGLGAD
ncbi:MAG: 6,7-dimethyl-8-ribityllumazine synthase [Gemmatimonadota bacterium]